MSYLNYIYQLLRNPKSVGSVVPSSRFLAQAMSKGIKNPENKVVVELGPGNGVITQYIAKVTKLSKLFFSIEINSSMAAQTRLKCPGVQVIEGSVEHISEFLSGHGHKKASIVISSLPWVSLPVSVQENLFNATFDSLEDGGQFIYFTYLGFNLLPGGRSFRKLINKNFKDVELNKVVLRNFPPAVVYLCRK